MTKQIETNPLRPKAKTGHQAESVLLPQRPAEFASLSQDEIGKGSAESKTFQLVTPYLQPVQRQRIASQIGQAHGNRLLQRLLQRQPKQNSNPTQKDSAAAFKPRKMTLEDVVKHMNGLGGPYKDLKEWKGTIVPGTFLGHPIGEAWSPPKGVRPEFLGLLKAAEPKIDAEFNKSGNPIPAGYGIRNVGGFRNEISVHGAGVAIDIDPADNPYIMHEGDPAGSQKNPGKLTKLSQELFPVYHHIAEFILNEPIDGEQSIVPKLITSGKSLPQGGKSTRRERLEQYYDRLAQESDAMREYFRLMKDEDALKSYLNGAWKTIHPNAAPPPIEVVTRQMWLDYALLGGEIPKDGPPGIQDFQMPRKAGRPFHPLRKKQKDPVSGFLTLPREVVLGLGQVVPRWGAIDFGAQSGDLMHFDDRYGIGKPFDEAKAPAKASVDAENKAAADAAREAAQAVPSSTSAIQPVIARQPAPGPGHRGGEAWDYGPVTKRKSVTHDISTFIGWIIDVEKTYGPDKQMVLQRLRRLHYSSYSGRAGAKFDKVIDDQAGAGGPPLTVLTAPARAVDGLYETDQVRTPDGRILDPGHILAALDLKTSGSTWKAGLAELDIGTTMLSVLTWAGDLASWWLEWTVQAKKIHDAPIPAPTGPATEEGPSYEVGGDPALDIGLWEKIGRSKASKEDLLGDMDAQILAQTSTQKSTAESIQREKREIRYANIGTELTAPVSKLLEQYYGVWAKPGTVARAANRFTAFVRHADPPIPYQMGEEGNARWISLAPDAEGAITKAIEGAAWLFVSQGTSHEPRQYFRTYGWRIKDIAKRFAAFLNEGLKKGDAPWL
jgi:hypothetical protein